MRTRIPFFYLSFSVGEKVYALSEVHFASRLGIVLKKNTDGSYVVGFVDSTVQTVTGDNVFGSESNY